MPLTPDIFFFLRSSIVCFCESGNDRLFMKRSVADHTFLWVMCFKYRLPNLILIKLTPWKPYLASRIKSRVSLMRSIYIHKVSSRFEVQEWMLLAHADPWWWEEWRDIRSLIYAPCQSTDYSRSVPEKCFFSFIQLVFIIHLPRILQKVNQVQHEGWSYVIQQWSNKWV